ncbi:MAG: hypothetical protein D3M94_07215 [Rhodocyclales bacterium GT-UBC]|nr:MAG: hypothetical protein D3M94_07215 [Rhodocyclales bacterium GT-UBC]
MINIPSPMATEAKLIIAAIAAIVCFGAGWLTNGWRISNEISDIKRDQEQARADALHFANAGLISAWRRGDDLSAKAADLEARNIQLSEGKTREIVRLTDGRPCIGSAAVRVLNRSTAPGQPGLSVPPASSEPAADDGGFATDTDIALWIAGAQRAYSTCQGRLKAIADFYTQEPAK